MRYLLKMANQHQKQSFAKKTSFGLIFWLLFFVVVSFLFFYNRDNIRRTIEDSIAADRPGSITGDTSDSELILDETQLDIDISQPPPAITVLPETSPQDTATERQPETPLVTIAPDLRERTMYFISVDRDGLIVRNRVNRNLPVTQTPLTDVFSALLRGPTREEQQRGLISLIPEGTSIINMIVRGSTVYINFSEDFQFNIYGIEGYAGALRQVIWTATEFPNIEDVQILIEGRRLDFLGEGVWIGAPLNRESY